LAIFSSFLLVAGVPTIGAQDTVQLDIGQVSNYIGRTSDNYTVAFRVNSFTRDHQIGFGGCFDSSDDVYGACMSVVMPVNVSLCVNQLKTNSKQRGEPTVHSMGRCDQAASKPLLVCARDQPAYVTIVSMVNVPVTVDFTIKAAFNYSTVFENERLCMNTPGFKIGMVGLAVVLSGLAALLAAGLMFVFWRRSCQRKPQDYSTL